MLGLTDGSGSSPSWMPTALLPTAASVLGGAILFTQRARVLDTMFDYIARGRSGKKPGQQYLKGLYAPLGSDVAERFDEDLVVEGTLPVELNGVYMRGGPNPFYPPVHGYHWFDGDGLLHATRIKDGKANYASHFIRTAKLRQEQAAKRSTFMKMGDGTGRRGLLLLMLDRLRKKLKVVDVSEGDGTANTALTFHAGRLLQLHEGDLPYQIRILCNGLIETIGRLKLPKVDGIEQEQFTAHPKIDAKTGELLFIGYNMAKNPYVKAGVFDRSGALTRQWTVDLPWPTMMHDMCITESYLVLLHMPLCFDPKRMVSKDTLPIVFDQSRPARIGLLRRDAPGGDATGLVRWFELPSCMVFHTIHACEDKTDNTVKIWACHFDSINLDLDEKGEYATPHLYTLDLATGNGTVIKLSDIASDFPVSHPNLLGRPARWAWMGTIARNNSEPDFNGIGKMDLRLGNAELVPDSGSCISKRVSKVDHMVKCIHFPEGCFGGEPYFVPRHAGAPTVENEDDGFLIVYIVHKDEPSKMHVYDARTMDDKPVAVVTLPQRVPLGFHGMWISEQQMRDQKAVL